jgi:hypothetical protein
MSTSLVSPPVVKAKSLACPHCGGPVELRGFAHTLSVVCPQCLSVLDASTPEVQVLQTFQGKERIQPKIPLGVRGTLSGAIYQVIGFQQRTVMSEGDFFSWDEYLLFNPYQGFRYLTEYEGHWNFVRVQSALPEPTKSGGRIARRFEGRNYLAFDAMQAQTSYVLGEFPWQVRSGDWAAVEDFVAPPYMLSSESTDGEVTWSLGEYTEGAKIWQAFQLPGSPPAKSGIFANQPSPYRGGIGSAWRTWLWLNVALFALMLLFTMMKADREVFKDDYAYVPGRSESAFVTPIFELTGRDSNIELAVHTDLNNNWAYFNFALINEETGQAFDFGREVSYYHDSDGSEGDRNDSIIVPGVSSGRYYLRIEPELGTKFAVLHYQISMRRDVPNYIFFLIAAGLLLIPPIFKTIWSARFEGQRWSQSDYAPMVSKAMSGAGGDE